MGTTRCFILNSYCSIIQCAIVALLINAMTTVARLLFVVSNRLENHPQVIEYN